MKGYFLLATFCIINLFIACNSSSNKDKITLHGVTMGTTYSIIYLKNKGENYQVQIDSILRKFNLTFSTYIDSSLISKFNQSDSFVTINDWFKEVMETSKLVFDQTKGAFNPAVMPLVNAWGFGYAKKMNIDSAQVDSLLQIIDFNKVNIIGDKLIKEDFRIQLDFSAIAKGYGVDVIAAFLEDKGIQNYMVEIGGEVSTKGINEKNEVWKIGIDKPLKNKIDKRKLQAIVQLKDKAMATSGNYRNYYEKNNKRYVHTINPVTGYPSPSDLLSASVIAKNCMLADAYATAFMVMGYEKSVYFVEKDQSLEAYYIYLHENEILTSSHLNENSNSILKEL